MQDQYKGLPKYRISGDVDNQLGHLHNKLRNHIPSKPGFQLNPHNDKHPNMFVESDVVPKKLAKRVRKFINQIPFDDNRIPQLDDITNPSRDSVYNELDDKNRTMEAYKNKIYDPNQWIYERYHVNFFRALPLTLEAFLGSPLIELFDVLEEKWHNTFTNNVVRTKGHRKITWVIQRIEKGHGIGWHNDDNGQRSLAFAYYLTPSDWDYKNDGGELCVSYDENQDKYESINPSFNTMVVWDMYNQRGPLHSVKEVKSYKKSRIALVGFFAKDF